MLKRKKLTKNEMERQRSFYGKDPISLECHKCNHIVDNLPPDVDKVTCCYCTGAMAAPPEGIAKKPTEKRQRGWQFKKEYIAPSGTVYQYGKEVKQ